ncbi:MAG TPA: YiiD C-terminal domain-containing protein [Kiritimatiellia bacterium]|nr:YiiD C-terminal domain-containing protein [Kiritimatiellia bacterium]
MERKALEAWLHRHIPLSAAMQVQVKTVEPERVILRAPLRPNRNHQHTAFGGSVSTMALLAAWALIHARLRDARIAHRLVVQRQEIDYQRPVTGPLLARAIWLDPDEWPTFVRALREKGKARIDVVAFLEQNRESAAHFHGTFVALAPEELVY